MPRLPVLLAAILLGAAAPAPAPGPAPTPVPLSRQPRTWMDAAAQRLAAQDMAEARRSGEIPLLLVGSARLSTGPADRAALFVQLQSPRECGSAGCNTMVFLWRNGQWVRVLDGVGGRLSVAATRTRGMADLLTDKERYVWTGTAYRDANPAPQVDLRPRG